MRGRRKGPTHIFAGKRPPNPILPKDYESYSVEQMLGMLDSALRVAGSTSLEEEEGLISGIMSEHDALNKCLHANDFKRANFHLSQLTGSNILTLLASKLINTITAKHLEKYGDEYPPDREFFRQATSLLQACKSAVNENLFNEIYGWLDGQGLAQSVEDISKLLEDFTGAEFAIFLSRKRTELAPIALPKEQFITQRFFKPEMVYLYECDLQPVNVEQKDHEMIHQTHRYQ